MQTSSGFSSLMTCWHCHTASAEPRYQVLPVRCWAGMASMNWSRMGARRQLRAMCSSSDALLYCVSTLMRETPELTKFERTMSMMR